MEATVPSSSSAPEGTVSTESLALAGSASAWSWAGGARRGRSAGHRVTLLARAAFRRERYTTGAQSKSPGSWN